MFTTNYTVKPGLNRLYVKTRASIITPRMHLTCGGCEIRDEEFSTTRFNNIDILFYGVEVHVEAPGLSEERMEPAIDTIIPPVSRRIRWKS